MIFQYRYHQSIFTISASGHGRSSAPISGAYPKNIPPKKSVMVSPAIYNKSLEYTIEQCSYKQILSWPGHLEETVL